MTSALGHERRPMQLATAPQLPLCPVSDRGVAARYVVEGLGCVKTRRRATKIE